MFGLKGCPSKNLIRSLTTFPVSGLPGKAESRWYLWSRSVCFFSSLCCWLTCFPVCGFACCSRAHTFLQFWTGGTGSFPVFLERSVAVGWLSEPGAFHDWDGSYGFIVTGLVLSWEAVTLFPLPSKTPTAHDPAPLPALDWKQSGFPRHVSRDGTVGKRLEGFFSAKTVLWSFPGCYIVTDTGTKEWREHPLKVSKLSSGV